jgi:hypothetical protein
MGRRAKIIIFIITLLFSSVACSVLNIGKQAHSAEQTALAVKTQVGGVIDTSSSLLKTAQAFVNSQPELLETARALTTQLAPLASTVVAVDRDHPGLIQTSQAAIRREIPTGEPPSDIPVLDSDQVYNFFGTSQYIFYTTPVLYPQVLEFYRTQMPENGWQYMDNKSHEYANAAELIYAKEARLATLNLSSNPLNQTSVVVIAIAKR